MKRVLVIGGYGAGKTVFARTLHQATGLPLHELDDIYRAHASANGDRETWLRTVGGIASGEAWIIDGNYGGTIDLRLRRADTVIFFDYPPLLCLLRTVKRHILSRLRLNRKDVVNGVNDRIDSRIVRSVLAFRRRHREGILCGVKKHPQIRLVVFRMPRDVKRFFEEIGKGA
ncbi:MAG: DNA topology modulation protein FlaR [Thermodesulfovibrionales bacterium]